MKVDVRARVLWGDPIEAIRDSWLAKGAPSPLLNSALEDSTLERRWHFHKRGLQDIGVAILCFCLGAFAVWCHNAVVRGAAIWIAMIGLPLAGLHFAFRGVRRLTTGGSAEESASDLSEFDHFSKQ
jgi:hypothetical protein